MDDLALRWGTLDVRGHADLGLDAAMQPEGSAAVQMTGFAEVIDALARSGAITRNDARVAATLLGLMARPGAGDVAAGGPAADPEGPHAVGRRHPAAAAARALRPVTMAAATPGYIMAR